MSDSEVTLRPIRDEDLDAFFRHQQDDAALHMAAFTSADPSDREAFNEHWARIRANPTVIARTIERGGDPVGHVARFERDGDVEVTYWIDRVCWGQGVATAALRQFLATLPERPIQARVAADNLASRRVLEKCGFQAAGEERGFANARGAEIHEVIYALTGPGA